MPLATVKYLFSILLPKYGFFPLETFMTKAMIGLFYFIVACDNMSKIVAIVYIYSTPTCKLSTKFYRIYQLILLILSAMMA